jgi:rifampicin phosphotransferase
MDWIIPLEYAVADVAAAGSKGANLGALIEAGLPVPHGCVLTTAAYDEFIRHSGQRLAIEAAAARVTSDDPTRAEHAAREIAARLAGSEVPDEIMAAILHAYEAMDGVPVAVRSSAAMDEDPGIPFEAQGDTVLNVLGHEALLQAVRACWTSLWSAKAIVYRARRRGVSVDDTSMAVIIQRMFRADTSGVLMTANLETLNADEMVIRAVRGFGQAVQPGQIIPQEIIFDRYSRSITRQSISGKLALMPYQAMELVRLAERIEYHFGCHQKIEWAWDEDTFCILQSRPIAVQIPPRIRWEPPHPGKTYTRQAMMELLPDPVSTLFETCGLPALEQGILGYYTHMGEAEASSHGIFETINGFVYQREQGPDRLTYLLSLPKMKRASEHAIDHWEHEARPQYQQEVEQLLADPQSLTPRQLTERINSLALAGGRYWAVVTEMLAPPEQAEQRFRALYTRLAQPGDPDPAIFLRGLELRSLQAERAFLAARDTDLDAFNQTYGCALYTLDFAVPLSGEDQSAWQVAARAWHDSDCSAQERFLRLYGERITAEDHIQARLSGWQRRMFGPALNAAQRAIQAREDALFELGLAWRPLRRFALELGQRLVAAGALQQPDQIFWLRRNELFVLSAALEEGKERIVSQIAKVLARQATCEAAQGLNSPLSIPERDHPEVIDFNGTLVGKGAGPGKITAPARLLRNSRDFVKLQPGEIIVATSIPPAWTPLFAVAGGVVTDLGGAHSYCSRAACVSGLPMVMETVHATHLIQDGDMITVDGDEGSLRLK